MPRHSLVTGATGFIGRVLTARLRDRGDCVRIVSRRADVQRRTQRDLRVAGDVRHYSLDLTSPAALPPGLLDGVDVVFHLAGKAHALSEQRSANDVEYQAANVDSTARLLEAAVAAGVSTFVFVSSAKAAGEPAKWNGAPLDEGVDLPPDTPYGRSKRAAEELVLIAGQRHGLHVCNLRPTLVYGPGVKGNLHKMLHAIDHRRFPPLPDVGNRRSLVYVGDVARAALLAAAAPEAAGQTYLVTDGQEYSTYRLYTAAAAALDRRMPTVTTPMWALSSAAKAGDAVWRLTGRRAPIDSPALDRLVESAWYSSSKITRSLGYRPVHTFETALPAMVARYRADR